MDAELKKLDKKFFRVDNNFFIGPIGPENYI